MTSSNQKNTYNLRYHQDPDYLLENILKTKSNNDSDINHSYRENNSGNTSRREHKPVQKKPVEKNITLNKLISFSYFDQQG